VALLYGELARAPIFPIRFEPVRFERDQAINRLLMEKAPLAVLAVRPQLWHRLHIFEDEDFPLPSATVRPDVGRALLASPNAPVVLSIRTQSARSHVATLVGRTAPRRQRRIALCAHYDTKFGTPGAHDNGTGVALLLALAARLADRDLAAGLDFVAFADEEYGAHTDGAYATQVGDGFADMVCAINLDGVGVLTENTTLTMLAQGEAFEQAVRAIMAGYPQVVWTDPWIQSNHYTYFARGVPSVALSSLTWERAHQAEDSIDWISPARLDEAMALVEAIVLQASQQTPSWSRPDEGPPMQ
jgi:aminopeptidase YwaD